MASPAEIGLWHGTPILACGVARRRVPAARCHDHTGMCALLTAPAASAYPAGVLEMDPGFLDVDGEHFHDDRVTSVGFHQPGELDMDKTNSWIARLLTVTHLRTHLPISPRISACFSTHISSLHDLD